MLHMDNVWHTGHTMGQHCDHLELGMCCGLHLLWRMTHCHSYS